MCKLPKHFQLAKQIAIKHNGPRKYKIGAVGIRQDGAIVKSANLPNRLPEPQAHAEARVVKKLDWGGIVYVARVLSDGKYAMAKPCKSCQSIMKLNGVKRCFYTINDFSYGVIEM
jgi:cytidine deaminase